MCNKKTSHKNLLRKRKGDINRDDRDAKHPDMPFAI